MKRIMSGVCFALLLFVYVLTLHPGAVNAQELPVDATAIRQRDYGGAALTDAYGIEILTEDSGHLRQKVYEEQLRELAGLQGRLLMSEAAAVDEQTSIRHQAQSAGLFQRTKYYSARPSEEPQSALPLGLLIVLFACLAALSFFAALAAQRRKRGKGDVHNDYSSTGRELL